MVILLKGILQVREVNTEVWSFFKDFFLNMFLVFKDLKGLV